MQPNFNLMGPFQAAVQTRLTKFVDSSDLSSISSEAGEFVAGVYSAYKHGKRKFAVVYMEGSNWEVSNATQEEVSNTVEQTETREHFQSKTDGAMTSFEFESVSM